MEPWLKKISEDMEGALKRGMYLFEIVLFRISARIWGNNASRRQNEQKAMEIFGTKYLF